MSLENARKIFKEAQSAKDSLQPGDARNTGLGVIYSSENEAKALAGILNKIDFLLESKSKSEQIINEIRSKKRKKLNEALPFHEEIKYLPLRLNCASRQKETDFQAARALLVAELQGKINIINDEAHQLETLENSESENLSGFDFRIKNIQAERKAARARYTEALKLDNYEQFFNVLSSNDIKHYLKVIVSECETTPEAIKKIGSLVIATAFYNAETSGEAQKFRAFDAFIDMGINDTEFNHINLNIDNAVRYIEESSINSLGHLS